MLCFPMEPSKVTIERLTAILGEPPVAFERVRGGYTATERWRCRAGTERVFVKVATTPVTAGMVHREIANYRLLRAAFVPEFLGADTDGAMPILAIEDLGGARWPPEWQPGDVDRMLATLEILHATPAPGGLAGEAGTPGRVRNGWTEVERDPGPFLSLGMADAAWLAAALPSLIAAADACAFQGDRLCHWDLRSDNMCFAARGPVLVDWGDNRGFTKGSRKPPILAVE